jgi:peptidoglycan/LPS O-acetylase OafA/YrhL
MKIVLSLFFTLSLGAICLIAGISIGGVTDTSGPTGSYAIIGYAVGGFVLGVIAAIFVLRRLSTRSLGIASLGLGSLAFLAVAILFYLYNEKQKEIPQRPDTHVGR